MCLSVTLPDGRVLETEQQLVDMWHAERPDVEVVFDREPLPCLCRINLRDIFAGMGYRLSWNGEEATATRRCDA